ncbi:hypothetical protein Aco03nite_097010 [Actinoplanes couchii]|uniref:Uncharacterized protein n=1 Tax=Actinoplanes couchii TaxID=403638 RepID=A0ABQ3XSE5_9ACTN|nr:hypothetical protein Aco03nite_097010 [Actinoplanes couchii]
MVGDGESRATVGGEVVDELPDSGAADRGPGVHGEGTCRRGAVERFRDHRGPPDPPKIVQKFKIGGR